MAKYREDNSPRVKETYSELALNFKEKKSKVAFSKLYKKIYPGIFNYVYKIIRDYDDTCDIVSATMLNVYTKIDQYDPAYQITTWVYKIAYNESIRTIREKNSKVSISETKEVVDNDIFDDIDDMQGLGDKDDTNKTEIDHIFEDICIKKNYESVMAEIRAMKSMYREVMIERFVNGLTYEEIEIKMNQPFVNKFNELQRLTDEAKSIWLKDYENSNKKKNFYMIRQLKLDYVKENMVNLQTVKNRIRRGRMILYEKFKNILGFEIVERFLPMND